MTVLVILAALILALLVLLIGGLYAVQADIREGNQYLGELYRLTAEAHGWARHRVVSEQAAIDAARAMRPQG